MGTPSAAGMSLEVSVKYNPHTTSTVGSKKLMFNGRVSFDNDNHDDTFKKHIIIQIITNSR